MSESYVQWHYNVTTIDPPELVRFIKHAHPDVEFNLPNKPFFEAAVTRGFPTRRQRWCCETYKEQAAPIGETLILGVRAEESPRRAKNWKEVTAHTHTGQYAISPIVAWTTEDVWWFIKERKLEYCSLYDEGFKRLGCVGCPMSGSKGRKQQFARWPHFERAWKNLFRQIWTKRTGTTQRNGQVWFGNRYFHNWEEMYEWWLSDRGLPNEECQGLVEMYS